MEFLQNFKLPAGASGFNGFGQEIKEEQKENPNDNGFDPKKFLYLVPFLIIAYFAFPDSDTDINLENLAKNDEKITAIFPDSQVYRYVSGKVDNLSQEVLTGFLDCSKVQELYDLLQKNPSLLTPEQRKIFDEKFAICTDGTEQDEANSLKDLLESTDVSNHPVAIEMLFADSSFARDALLGIDTLKISSLPLVQKIIEYESLFGGYIPALDVTYSGTLSESNDYVSLLNHPRISINFSYLKGRKPSRLQDIIDFSAKLPGTRQLTLSENVLNNSTSTIPHEIILLQNLEVLNINSHHMKELPTFIDDLINLTEISLYADNIVDLSSLDRKKLSKLQTLILSSDQLDRLPLDIGKLKNIEKIGLVFCEQIRSIPKSILALPSLKEIEIYNDGFSDPFGKSTMKNLREWGKGSNKKLFFH